MACNRDSAADGASPAPPPPAPSTPGSCPSPDVRLPCYCCNNNGHFPSGCAAPVSNLCPKCSSERLRKEESPFNASEQQVDLASESAVVAVAAAPDVASVRDATPTTCPSAEDVDKKDATDPFMADIADLCTVMKSKSSASRCTILDSASGGCADLEQRIPSFSLSPSRQGEVALSGAPPSRDRAVNRCGACRKRVGLVGFKCRCGDLFCASHRYSDKHDCSFDYKAAGRLAIAKDNPVVIASNINKI